VCQICAAYESGDALRVLGKMRRRDALALSENRCRAEAI